LERAHQLDPRSPLVAAELTFLYLEHGGDKNVALSLAQTVKQTMPDSPIAMDTLGWAYYKMGSPDSAILELRLPQKRCRQSELSVSPWMAYLAAKRYALAERCLETAVRIDPNFLDVDEARNAC